jgi:DNA-(apurinic or apyrimidinic site) lyase
MIMRIRTMNVDEGRVRAVAEAFSHLGRDGVVAFERRDPQMGSAVSLAMKCGPVKASALLGINALVSYMLTERGEEFWDSFSKFASERCSSDPVSVVIEFTRIFNRFNLKAKLTRLQKVMKCLSYAGMETFTDLEKYWSFLRKCLNLKGDEKTLVFSVKMVYYGLKASGMKVEAPSNVPIPVDRRVSIVTLTSGIIKGSEPTLQGIRKDAAELMRRRRRVTSVWNEVARRSAIPPLHLDAPVWLVGRYVNSWSRRNALEGLKHIGLDEEIGINKLRRLIDELLYLLPP